MATRLEPYDLRPELVAGALGELLPAHAQVEAAALRGHEVYLIVRDFADGLGELAVGLEEALADRFGASLEVKLRAHQGRGVRTAVSGLPLVYER
ncbi:MAG TPA: hypothetical protein VFS43_29740 [Polyangiaceae bacterium]|nr:hypothetical protein [Polyangiaceae bacterium]